MGEHWVCASRPGAGGQARPIDRRDGAEPAQVRLVGRAGGADHGDSAEAGELDHRGADAAGRAVHQERSAGPDPDLGQDARRGFDRHGQPGRRFERQILRLGGPDPGSQHRELRQQVEPTAEHRVPRGDAGDPRADFIHDAGAFDPDAGGQWNRLALPAAGLDLQQIRTIDPGSPDGDPHLAGTRMRGLHVDHPQHLGAAIGVELNCFHEELLGNGVARVRDAWAGSFHIPTVRYG